ncbi:MAG TPA: TonB-dependent receptor [Pyrinomonadaceae bacterium]|jgi:hypothetical protein|nr:TonB-dependent receptor [Pyrinomonadaceae bacterium]
MRFQARSLAYSLCAIAFVLAVLIAPTSLRAQEARGTIAGTVVDANKAVIPGATVTITNVAMGTSHNVQTNDRGLFTVPYLIPGTYRIVVEAQGFKRYIREGIELQVNDRLEIDPSLEVGGSQETVTVTADAGVIESSTASMGQVVDARRVSELPTPHGDPFFLIGLAGGTTFGASAVGGRDVRLDRPFEPTHITGYSIDGTRPNRGDVTIDGAPSTSVANAFEVTASYVPPTDIIQEVKVQTASFDAQFGNTEGGVTNIVIKSGTNDINGSAYWVKMPVSLAANDFFANRNGTARPQIPYDRPGFTVTGPVVLPKIYNGRNKTFFSWGYEYIKDIRTRNNGNFTTPTDAMKAGDFSALLALGSQYQIFNPYSRRINPQNTSQFILDPFKCDGAGNPIVPTVTGTQVGGTNCNKLPTQLVNPVARSIVNQYWPSPLNTPSSPDGSNNYLQPDLVETARYYTNTIRIDHVFNNNHRMFGRASWYTRNSDYNNFFKNLATGQEFQFISRQFTIDDVYSLNATTVLNVQYSYNRFIRVDGQNSEGDGFDLTTVGFPARYQALVPEDKRHFPAIGINGYLGTRVNDEFRPNDIHSFRGVVNKVFNTHSMKFGTEFRAYRENSFNNINDWTGRFDFTGDLVRGPITTSAGAPNDRGQSFAQFLLGLPSQANSYIARLADYAEQSTSWGFFAHDDWRIHPRLTLNLGLRYEFEGGMTERYNRSVRDFPLDYIQPIEGAARAKYALNPIAGLPADQFFVRGGLTFAAVNGEPRELYNTPRDNFMPRLGFAYQLTEDGKTVIRGGYGEYYGFLGQRRGDVNQTGFSQNTPFITVGSNGFSIVNTLSNPFPDGVQEPVGAGLGFQTNIGNAVTFFNPNPEIGKMQRWQFSIQRELPWGFVVEAAYVGNKGSDIEVNRNLNATPLKYLSTSPLRDATVENFLGGNVPNPLRDLVPTNSTIGSGTNIIRERLLRPYPHFDTVNTTTNEGQSWYHSGQLNVQKRFSQGYTVNLAYTWSKFIEQIDLLNASDPAPTKMISAFDAPHRVALSWIYELPFGKGKAIGDSSNPVISRVLTGWQVTGIYAWQVGPPLNFATNVIYLGGKIALPEDQRSLNRWFDTSRFDTRATALINGVSTQIQPTGRNIRTFPLRFSDVRAENVNNVDVSLFKNTAITEGTKFQIRFDLLNALNHPWLFSGGAIQMNPTASNFGQITAGNQANYARRVQVMLKFIF